MSTYEYQALQDDKDEIRLLRVHPALNPDEAVICDLRTVKLSTRPEYAALSYTWGPLVYDNSLTLNGHTKYITSSLHYALRCFRTQGWQMIWADALCINQDNIDERAQQVRIMWQIYSQAKCVFASLGKGGPDGPLSIALMYDLALSCRYIVSPNLC
jgi:hypothetical protein